MASSRPSLSELFSRLVSFGATSDRRINDIERQYQRLQWDEPAELESEDRADQLLKEMKEINAGYKDVAKTLSETKDHLDGFLETTQLQLQDMTAVIRRYEAWAASFGGYVPKFDLDVDLEAGLKALEKEKETHEKQEQEEEKEEEEEEEPNIFDAGLSRATMERLGYKFKGTYVLKFIFFKIRR